LSPAVTSTPCTRHRAEHDAGSRQDIDQSARDDTVIGQFAPIRHTWTPAYLDRTDLDPSDLDDHRDDHRAAAVVVADPAAHRPADHLAQLGHLADAVGGGTDERPLHHRAHLVECRLVDPRAPGVDLRPRHQLAVGGVHDHHHRHEAL